MSAGGRPARPEIPRVLKVRWFYRKSSSPKNDSKDARRGDATPRKPPRRFLEERSSDRGPNDRVRTRRPFTSTGSEVVLLRRHADDGSAPSERAAHKFGRAGDFEAS
jgi:hypothetical protein